ncbi:MAG: trimeric autotransporter adhesin, partial [Gaiellaceae bacterium]|nr:trimeric autotransporter adhesin [Gaiellaceae bacterium]
FDSTNSAARQVFGRPGQSQARMYADIDLDAGGVAYPFQAYELWAGTFAGASSAVYRNGNLLLAGDAGAASLSGLALGGLSTAGQYGYDFGHTFVAELLVYSGALTASQRQSVGDWLNQKYAVLGPASTAPPTLAGSPTEGSTLTASTGTWAGATPMSFAYQWQRCTAAGDGCVSLTGATASSYQLGSADVGATLRVLVTATNSAGSGASTSAPSSVVAAAAPASTSPPLVTGSPVQGQTVAASPGTWTGTTPIAFAYEWRRCDASGNGCTAIATGPSYLLGAADAGATVRVAVTASNSGGSATAVSAPTAVSAAAGPSPPVTAGLQLWFDAGQETYADGAAVTRWSDHSGFARDLTAADAGAAPTFRAGAVNGRPALEFDGAHSLLKTYGSAFTIAQPDTFFIVYRDLAAAGSGSAFVFDSTNSSVRQLLGRGTGENVEMYADVALTAPATFPFAGFDLWSGTFAGGTSSLYRNGALTAQGRAGSASLAGFTLGALSTSGPYGYDYGHTLVAEVLWYSGTITPAQRQSITDWLTQRYALGAPQTPPSPSSPPAISGSTVDGGTLTASAGSWSGTSPFAFGYQWQRCSAAGSACAAVPGAAGTSYAVGPADVGSTLRVAVTASNSAGSATASSDATALVTAAAPSSTAAPSVAGTAAEGQTLTASTGTWSGTAPIAYAVEWRRCDASGNACTAVGTGASYVPATADVGSTMRAAVTASNAAGTATAVSAPTGAVAPLSTGGAAAPPVTAGLQLWFDAGQETYADGAPVTRWSDRSGFARDLSAADGGAAPTFRRNAIAGRPALEFDGANSLLKTYGSTFTIAQPDTFFIVYRDLASAGSSSTYVFDSTNSSIRQILGRGGAQNVEMYADVPLASGALTFPFPGYEVWSGTFAAGASALYRNGSLVAQGRAGSASLAGLAVGALSTSGPYGYAYSHVLVAEILWYAGSLSAQDRQSVTDWLKTRYALG